MPTDLPRRAAPALIWNGGAEPDVTWGASGIDALIWADPPAYAEPISHPPTVEPRSQTV
jgi:hypothetical protein